MIAFASMLLLNSISAGFCFPGIVYDNSRATGRCPVVRFDKSLWRRSGESRTDYRLRIRQSRFIQPVRTLDMLASPTPGLTMQEVYLQEC
jgi:hypothetical protein